MYMFVDGREKDCKFFTYSFFFSNPLCFYLTPYVWGKMISALVVNLNAAVKSTVTQNWTMLIIRTLSRLQQRPMVVRYDSDHDNIIPLTGSHLTVKRQDVTMENLCCLAWWQPHLVMASQPVKSSKIADAANGGPAET